MSAAWSKFRKLGSIKGNIRINDSIKKTLMTHRKPTQKITLSGFPETGIDLKTDNTTERIRR
jgi:hypothetical protein